MTYFPIVAPSQGVISQIASIHETFLRAYGSGESVALDVSALESADVTFAQLVVAMAKSMREAGRDFVVTGLGAPFERLVARAGIPFDPASGRLLFQ